MRMRPGLREGFGAGDSKSRCQMSNGRLNMAINITGREGCIRFREWYVVHREQSRSMFRPDHRETPLVERYRLPQVRLPIPDSHSPETGTKQNGGLHVRIRPQSLRKQINGVPPRNDFGMSYGVWRRRIEQPSCWRARRCVRRERQTGMAAQKDYAAYRHRGRAGRPNPAAGGQVRAVDARL